MHEERDKQAAKVREERDRLLAAVDEYLERERGRNELRRQELEAGL
jgi:hypothetical protein